MRRLGCILILLAACGGDDGGGAAVDAGARPDAPGDAAAADASLMPMTLGETGLYAGELGGELAPGVVEYQVAWELWSDGAAKRRFVLLPEGAVIDSSDMDFWTYPVGTRIWKEFSVEGARIETRLLWKQAPGEWLALAFAWSEDGGEAIAAPDGVEDALGTSHDIPRERDCLTCHAPQPDMVLGLSALQLDHAPGEVTLASLAAGGRLSDPPAGEGAPYFPLPGDEVDRAALGLLHGNCGGCHFAGSDVQEQTSLELRLAVGELDAVDQTAAYRTA